MLPWASVLLQTVRSRSAIFKIGESSASAETIQDNKASEIAIEIASAIPQNIELPLLIATGKLAGDKQLTQKVLEQLSVYLSNALEEKYYKSENCEPHVSALAHNLRKRSIVRILDTISKAQIMLSQNCNINLLSTWLCANIRQSRHI